jgi:hypothetical protein
MQQCADLRSAGTIRWVVYLIDLNFFVRSTDSRMISSAEIKGDHGLLNLSATQRKPIFGGFV